MQKSGINRDRPPLLSRDEARRHDRLVQSPLAQQLGAVSDSEAKPEGLRPGPHRRKLMPSDDAYRGLSPFEHAKRQTCFNFSSRFAMNWAGKYNLIKHNSLSRVELRP